VRQFSCTGVASVAEEVVGGVVWAAAGKACTKPHTAADKRNE
jgi:hypothetical protein